MKSGRANRWATREFEQEAKTGRLRFLDWLDFEDEFRKDFMPLDAEAAAINVLQTTTYFQGKRLVDDYLNQFHDLIYDSGYTNPKTVVVKFRRGLDRRISTALAGMAFGRPSDTDPEAWFCLAVRIDQNRTADEAFHVSHRQPYPPTLSMNRPSGDIPTRPGCTSPAVRPLKPVPGQSCPNGHRRSTKGRSHSRHLPTLRKNWTLGEGVRPPLRRPIHGYGRVGERAGE